MLLGMEHNEFARYGTDTRRGTVVADVGGVDPARSLDGSENNKRI